VDIRELADPDIPAVIVLWRRCGLLHPENDPAADIARARAAQESIVLVGCEGGTLVATVMVGFDGHRGHVYYLAVEPNRQRSGLGKAMLSAASDWLRRRDAPKLLLMVEEGNAVALRFYDDQGFTRSLMATLARRLV
jgi:ribosomal protein S18 acetylase RimI-like enzyme